tara:strand:+ start:10850 stop:12757 length:1908 start_codon:yes stop_codon:yes gene_type:complete
MYCQIEKVILFPKNEKLPIREVVFKTGKVNIIYGDSQTGKSAIISIIDWCLASSKPRIPIGVVRDCCKAFGVVLKLQDQRFLIKRLTPDEKIQLDAREFSLTPLDDSVSDTESYQAEFTDDMASIKKFLNEEVLQIPNIKIKENDSNRIGFRDTVALNYQPQNIVANPSSFFYKSDENKYRSTLANAFPLILKIEDFENYQNKIKLESLNRIEKYLLKMEGELKGDALKAYAKINDILHRGISLGLDKVDWIARVEKSSDVKKLRNALDDLNFSDLVNSISFDETIASRMLSLQQEDAQNTEKHFQSTNELRYLKQLLKHSDKSISESIEFESLEIASEMLAILSELKGDLSDTTQRELHNISDAYQAKKPVVNISVKEDINNKISTVEGELRNINKEAQRLLAEQNKLLNEQSKVDKIMQFLVDIKNAVYRCDGDSNGIKEKLDNILSQKNKLNIKSIYHLKKIAYAIIDGYAQAIIAPLNSEYDDIYFDEKRLSVKVKKGDSDDFFPLSETGSGSNWVASHIAMTLAIHRYGIDKKALFSSFIIYDQPSQVYYPHETEDSKGNISQKGVKEVSAMVKSMIDTVKETNGGLQVILLDHAGENVWGEHKDDIHLVDSKPWRGKGQALIPRAWLKS